MGIAVLSRALLAFALSAAAAPALAHRGTRGDANAGAAIYSRCAACHALAYDRTGPRHCGLIGRRAGSVKGFAYSQAMRHANFVWNARTLDRFLANPMKAVPGTSMGYAGIKDAQERADLIAYLKTVDTSPACRKAR